MPTNSKEYNRKNYEKYWGKPSQIKKRSEQNKARKMAGLKVGDSREADHIKPLDKGGKTTKGNIRVLSRKKNRQRGVEIANNKKGSGYKKAKTL